MYTGISIQPDHWGLIYGNGNFFLNQRHQEKQKLNIGIACHGIWSEGHETKKF